MKLALPYGISIPLILFALALITVFMLFIIRQNDPRLADAENSYRQGELAKTIGDRKKAFNESLRIYQELEQEYQPTFGSGKLYYNIGNTYFQLEEYPYAVYNYLRAQKLRPRDNKATLNLEVAQDKLFLEKSHPKTFFSKVFFFHSYLSLPERLQVFFFLSLLALVFSSASIWASSLWLKRGMWISICLAGIFLLSLAYTQYFSPLQGVLIQSTDLYRDAGRQYAKVGEAPLPAGIQVEVIDVAADSKLDGRLEGKPDSKWLKIISPTGDPGFVPNENIRLL